MNHIELNPNYELICDLCGDIYISGKAFPLPQLCPKCFEPILPLTQAPMDIKKAERLSWTHKPYPSFEDEISFKMGYNQALKDIKPDRSRLLTDKIRTMARSMIACSHNNNLDEKTFDNYLNEIIAKIASFKDAEWERETECLMEEALKVGRRDVVEWLNNLVVGQKLLSGEQAQNKLKDWGIEQPE